MIISSFAELPHVAARAVIINCNTRLVTTLSLLSALRYADLPILLIDCESTDGSWDWFCRLSEQHAFTLLKMPLRQHGETLDTLFQQMPADQVLLIDSDLEILDANIVANTLRAASGHSKGHSKGHSNYGAGFLHAAEWIENDVIPASANGFHMARMWIPFTCLKVAPLRAAIAAGCTFMQSRDYFEFPPSKIVSKLLYARYRLPVLKKLKFKFLHRLRTRDGILGPAFHEYDTGARLHEHLTQSMRLKFEDLGADLWSTSVKHYHGVTRATLAPGRDNATPPNLIANEVNQRLRDEYGITVYV